MKWVSEQEDAIRSCGLGLDIGGTSAIAHMAIREKDKPTRVRNAYNRPGIIYFMDSIMKRMFDRVTVNPGIMNGQPCIRGMRLTVRRVVEAVAVYPTRDELKSEYPELEDEDIQQALEFAANNLDDQVIDLDSVDTTAA